VQAEGAPLGPQTYTVRAGDTLATIARRLLGDDGQWQEIARANSISDPRALQIGAVLTIPSPAGQRSAPPGPAPDGGDDAPVDAPAPSTQVIHTVAKGDTLAALAQRYLGDASKWRVIAEANGIADARSLKIGQPLVIPGAAPSAQPQEPAEAPSGNPPEATADTSKPASNPSNTPPEATSGTDGKQAGKPPDATPETGDAPEPEAPKPGPSAGAADHLVTDPKAFLRSDPPALTSTGELIPAGTKVRVLESTVKETRSYVKVEQVLQDGDPGPANVLGWTSKANLAGFEGGGHDKENDATLRPDDAILLGGLTGLERSMAIIYNAKAKYLHEQAQALGISTAAAAAVLKIESGGGGFANDGRMIIRFENHVFYDRWGKNNKATFDKHFQYNADKRWQGHRFREGDTGDFVAAHQSQGQEWQILQLARGLSNDPALEAISMGAAQIMGFNYATEGYASVQEMFDQMSGAIKPQIVGMFTFIKNTSLCINGLKEGDYVKFAKGYNGSGQAEAYGANIKAAADAWTKVTEGKTHGG
jgi:LysM repeat protein